MREKWFEDFDQRARRFWTPERTLGLFGDKCLAFPPVSHGPLLRSMDLLQRDASMSPESVRKYQQICHMYLVIEPPLTDQANLHDEVRVLDLACGNSYLTLTIAEGFLSRIRRPARILGVDRNARLIEACRDRAWRLRIDDMLRFETSSIDALDMPSVWSRAFGAPPGEPPVHLLVSLHACDTATDDAIALGLALNVPVMAVVPCCQAELAKRWASDTGPPGDPLEPIRHWPHLRRELAATMTDTLRALLLRGCGYHTTPIEFVPTAHTPKNTLLRAVRSDPADGASFAEYLAMRRLAGDVRLRLERILPSPFRERLAREEASAAPQTA